MKPVAGLPSKFEPIIKRPLYNSSQRPREKYIPSQKSIRALEIAYKKKVNKSNFNSERVLTAIKNVR